MDKTTFHRVGEFISHVWGGARKREGRVFLSGLSASGKTTILYKLNKPEQHVEVIPTIGFNVETLHSVVPDPSRYDHSQDEDAELPSTVDVTIWDAGGGDKMRPLFRRYFPHNNVLVFVVDATDDERKDCAAEDICLVAYDDVFLDQGTRFLIAVNKMDCVRKTEESSCQKKDCAVVQYFQSVATALEQRFGHVPVVPLSATTGEGMHELLQTMVQLILRPRIPVATAVEKLRANQARHLLSPEGDKARMRHEKFQSWLLREDEADEVFLQHFHEYTLRCWDHYTHLRIAFLLLQQHGRRDGMKLIFEGIKNFIDHSRIATRWGGASFHETMTYFWVHMVHYAMATTTPAGGFDKLNFKTFLAANPHLVDSGLFLQYYSPKLMLSTRESRETVMLPDKCQLPSLLTDSAVKNENEAPTTTSVIKENTALDDASFLDAVKQGTAVGSGHGAQIRALWCVLQFVKNKHVAQQEAFRVLRSLDGQAFHFTRTFFWLQQVSLAHTEAPAADTFDNFMEKETFNHLQDPDHIFEYYSPPVLERGTLSLVRPDKKHYTGLYEFSGG